MQILGLGQRRIRILGEREFWNGGNRDLCLGVGKARGRAPRGLTEN